MDKLNTDLAWELFSKMDEKEKGLLISSFNIPDILKLLSDDEFRNVYIECYKDYLRVFDNISNLSDGNPCKSKAEKLYESYNSLDEESKKELSVLLYNDQKFQDYLTQILMGSIKKEMPEMLTFFKLFGIDLESTCWTRSGKVKDTRGISSNRKLLRK